MVAILIFRVCLVLVFLIALLKMGDWKNWQKYYPTALFVMAVNLSASFLTYHHIPDGRLLLCLEESDCQWKKSC